MTCDRALAPAGRFLIVGTLSGAPALLAQVAWTREVALATGAESQSLALVVGAFFGGLGLGAALLGSAIGRSARAPLERYAALELAIAAMLVTYATAALPSRLAASFGSIEAGAIAPRLAAGLCLIPPTMLMGGTLPALLQALGRLTGPERIRRDTGQLVALNTAGSVLGVGIALWLIPTLGLRSTLLVGAGLCAVAGCAALGLTRVARVARSTPRPLEVWRRPRTGHDTRRLRRCRRERPSRRPRRSADGQRDGSPSAPASRRSASRSWRRGVAD